MLLLVHIEKESATLITNHDFPANTSPPNFNNRNIKKGVKYAEMEKHYSGAFTADFENSALLFLSASIVDFEQVIYLGWKRTSHLTCIPNVYLCNWKK